MKFLLLLVMLTACDASPQDLSGKMFTFPQQTKTARVRLTASRRDFTTLTVCHRSFTDLKRDHTFFSMSTPATSNAFLMIWDDANKEMEPHVWDKKAEYGGQDYKPNMWHSICTTWDSASGLVQLWLDGKPSMRKFVNSGTSIRGSTIIILGQEQDSHGGGFDINQSFVGMLSDIHMWDHTLSQCQIQNYADYLTFTAGNLLNWRTLEFLTKGRMALLLLLVMLTACAAAPQDLSGKMFTFPQQTNSAQVRLTTSRQYLRAVTVCLRYFTDLGRDYSLFSLATPSADNALLIYKWAASDQIHLSIRNSAADFRGQDYRLNTWHSVCATWDSASGVGQMWLDGKPSSRKFISSGSDISGPIIIVLGQICQVKCSPSHNKPTQLRYFTDLRRDYSLFSLATPSAHNALLIFKTGASDRIDLWFKNSVADFVGQDNNLNTWHSVCATSDSASGLGQLWLDGKPSSRKFISSGSDISGPIIIVLGQMAFLLLLVMLTACAAMPQDLSGKMLTFPEQTNTANVRLITSAQNFSAVTVCLRSKKNWILDGVIITISMAFLLLLVMLTACAAMPQDLSGKMLTFPEQTNTANVRLITSAQNFSAVTVCLRSFTDLNRAHALFSLATSSVHNAFLIFKNAEVIELYVQDRRANFAADDYKLNMWQSVCSTWDYTSGLGQLWLDGKPSIRKFIGGSRIGTPIIILGQEQDSPGGGFDADQSFVGMISDVHMWDYALSTCEIKHYVEYLNFTPGNVLNWRALEFVTNGRVLIEDQQMACMM
ncbi:hypothetical protein ABVT39_009220 [Epinephelus coioides]